MQTSTLQLRSLILGFLLVAFATLSSAAQTQIQANDYQDSQTFRTASPGLAVDSDMGTAATLNPILLAGAALRVVFPGTIQSGQQAILYVKPTAAGSLLDATVLGRMTIRTYMSTSPTTSQSVQEVLLTDKSINVNLLPGTNASNKVVFTANQAFDQLELRISGVASVNSDMAVYAVFGSVAPLPVQLTTFQGKATATGVALNWETASEQNADYFEVQRAEGPASGYSSLGQVKCAGTSAKAHHYQFVDAHATGLCYYRLRQVDAAGAETFSPLVTVTAGLVASLTAYPTVATDVVHLAGLSGTQLHILNEQGQQVQTALLATNQPQPLDVSGLPSGVYFLRDAATGHSLRFIKSSGR
jgi:hypothetical protein